MRRKLAGQRGEFGDVRGDGGGVHAAQADTFVKRQQIEHGQLAGEALGGGNGFFDARGQRHGDVGLDGHGGLGVIGDGKSLMALAMRFFKRGEGVAGFAGLRENQHAGMTKVNIARAAADTVFARVLDVDGEAAEVFEKNFAVEATVAAGSAGSDEDFARCVRPVREFRGDFRPQAAPVKVKVDCALQRFRLLVDFAQHGMRKDGHGHSCFLRGGMFTIRYPQPPNPSPGILG